MKIANPGKEYMEIDESTLPDIDGIEEKVHLVKLAFEEPTEEKMDSVLSIFDKTNRFIIEDNIKFYNDYLKNTTKKYYVENKNTNLITFFRKNNKVLLNLARLEPDMCSCIFNHFFYDILKNVEVIKVTKHQFHAMESQLKNWKGNVVIIDV